MFELGPGAVWGFTAEPRAQGRGFIITLLSLVALRTCKDMWPGQDPLQQTYGWVLVSMWTSVALGLMAPLQIET